MLVIDSINNVTLANGLVRIQAVRVGPDGQNRETEELAIPADQYGNVVQALQKVGQDLQQKIEQSRQQQGEQGSH